MGRFSIWNRSMMMSISNTFTNHSIILPKKLNANAKTTAIMKSTTNIPILHRGNDISMDVIYIALEHNITKKDNMKNKVDCLLCVTSHWSLRTENLTKQIKYKWTDSSPVLLNGYVIHYFSSCSTISWPKWKLLYCFFFLSHFFCHRFFFMRKVFIFFNIIF